MEVIVRLLLCLNAVDDRALMRLALCSHSFRRECLPKRDRSLWNRRIERCHRTIEHARDLFFCVLHGDSTFATSCTRRNGLNDIRTLYQLHDAGHRIRLDRLLARSAQQISDRRNGPIVTSKERLEVRLCRKNVLVSIHGGDSMCACAIDCGENGLEYAFECDCGLDYNADYYTWYKHQLSQHAPCCIWNSVSLVYEPENRWRSWSGNFLLSDKLVLPEEPI